MQHTSIYYHIPFCRRRCGYCDFNTFAGHSRLIPDYVESLCQEIKIVGQSRKQEEIIHTLFFGGGTPSLLKPDQIQEIIETTRDVFQLTPDAEISMEANPGTVTLSRIGKYVEVGINRFSFGMQSAHPDDLRILDRNHTFDDVVSAVKACHLAGIHHVNLDLIFAIPGQTLERWQDSLNRAIDTGVDHLSLYALTIEEDTPMYVWVNKGLIPLPDDDLAAEMYDLAGEVLEKNGFSQYEISNWSRGEQARCRHNLQYWEYGPYYGFGAGAHGFIEGTRTENVSLIPDYIARINKGFQSTIPAGPAAKTSTRLTQWDQMQEMMMVGLRLTESGVIIKDFARKFGVNPQEAFPNQFQKLLREGLIEIIKNPEECVRLTKRGRLLGNQVFLEFVGNKEPAFLKPH